MTWFMDLDRALELARQHHADQLDQAGRPHFGHVCRVVKRVNTPDEKLAAAMHDLLEDTDLTAHDLLLAGAPPEVVEAVVALTRSPGDAPPPRVLVRHHGGRPPRPSSSERDVRELASLSP